MNLGNIVVPNSKGQIVIPYKLRHSLGIDSQTPLQVVQAGHSLVLHPVVAMVTRSGSKDELFAQVLNMTRGAWAGDSWEKTRAGRRKVELAASKKRKLAW